MEILQTFAFYAVILALMTPLLLFYGIPFILIAKVVHHYTALWLSGRARFVLACGVAALGIAPTFDPYGGPYPFYLDLIDGNPINPGGAAVALLVTWGIVMLKLKTLHRRHARSKA